MSDTALTFPNKEVQAMWPELFIAIRDQVKNEYKSQEPLEKRIRTMLKEKLGADNIRNDDGYKKFFREVIRYAVTMDVDKMSSRIQGGRAKYGENRHSKGKITEVDKEMNFD